MEYIVILLILILSLIIAFFTFSINIKKIKKVVKNDKLDKLVSKFPENKQICEKILKNLDNTKVKIKEDNSNEKQTSLYIAISDTIFIANIKNSYTRIQTIAHECLHSIQDRRLLIFNFIYSNIYLIYFILSIILTIFRVYTNYNLQIIILIIMGFIYYLIRSHLEMDAMTKAKYVAKDYIEEYIKDNPVCAKEEVKELSNEYEKINNIGIPATNVLLFFNCIIKVVSYVIVVAIMTL